MIIAHLSDLHFGMPEMPAIFYLRSFLRQDIQLCKLEILK